MRLEQLDQLLTLRESGRIDRRQLLGALLAMGAARPLLAGAGRAARDVRLGRTLNHVTLSVADAARSRSFYEQLLGLKARAASAETTVIRLENGFLALDTYASEKPDEHPRGIDHFCLGIDQYQPERLMVELRRDFPDAEARREGEQVYLHDPDGATVQLCPVDYRR